MAALYHGSLDNVRDQYALAMSATGARLPREAHLEAFDRAVAAHDQKVATQAMRDLAHDLTDGKDPEMDPRIFDPWDVAELLVERADQIAAEGQS